MNPASNLTFRPYQHQDYLALKSIMEICYADLQESYATEAEMQLLSCLYPNGQLVCLLDGVLVGAILSRIVPFHKYDRMHDDAASIHTEGYAADAALGNSVYALDLFVLPAYHQLKIGRKLHVLLEKQIFDDNFFAMIATSRVSNYHQYQPSMDCETYVQKVKNREIADQVLSFHLSNGGNIGRIVPNFNPDDAKSCGFGVFLYILNPHFDMVTSIYPQRIHGLENYKKQLTTAVQTSN